MCVCMHACAEIRAYVCLQLHAQFRHMQMDKQCTRKHKQILCRSIDSLKGSQMDRCTQACMS